MPWSAWGWIDSPLLVNKFPDEGVYGTNFDHCLGDVHLVHQPAINGNVKVCRVVAVH